MAEMQALWIDKSDLRRTKRVAGPAPEPGPGEILVAVERFALTANNVSYAVTGDALGYWRFFPADDGWGQAPVWGFADVIVSNAEEIAVGERLYGYFTMASHLILKPAQATGASFVDAAAHRAELPPLYNVYSRTKDEPEALRSVEDARCLYFPLFMTSYLLFDYLTDNGMFGARQAIIGSASSKTGFGLGKPLAELEGGPKVVGATGAGNKGFAEALGCYDQIIAYDETDAVAAEEPGVYIDMSGNGALTEALHHRLGEKMRASVIVGATHWEAGGPQKSLPGAKPTFFFAPAQMQKRDAEWGRGVLMKKAMEQALRLSAAMEGDIEIQRLTNADAVAAAWGGLLENKVPPTRGLIASLL